MNSLFLRISVTAAAPSGHTGATANRPNQLSNAVTAAATAVNSNSRPDYQPRPRPQTQLSNRGRSHYPYPSNRTTAGLPANTRAIRSSSGAPNSASNTHRRVLNKSAVGFKSMMILLPHTLCSVAIIDKSLYDALNNEVEFVE